MRMATRFYGVSAIVISAVSIGSCGGSPSSPSTDNGGGTPVSTTTITITSAGVSPAAITISPGTRVVFVNNDNRQHEMDSDPHPEHTDCPAINNVGFISPGQQKETGNLNAVRTCGYHDHGDPNNSRLRGRIIIQ